MDLRRMLMVALMVVSFVGLIDYSFLCYTVYSDATNGKTVFDAHYWLFYSNVVFYLASAGLATAVFAMKQR